MWGDEFAAHLKLESCWFIEPMWKMLLSNKGLLPVLWEKYPGHPNLLPAYFSKEEFLQREPGSNGSYVEKPKLSREGANVTIVEGGSAVASTPGDYGDGEFIYQGIAPVADFDGNRPVMGVWIVNHDACGLGIREDTSRITGNLSRFVPHLF
jgi:glutathionylspermidine synthase